MRRDDLEKLQIDSGKANFWLQTLALLPVYLLQFCYGMNQGYPAILSPQLLECKDDFRITIEEESWIASLDNFAPPIVCILSGYLQQAIGPKKVVMICCVPYGVAWVLAAVAQSVEYLYVSRVLVGISTAIVTTTVYTVEVSSKDMRGTNSLIESALRCLGCLVVYALGFWVRWNIIATFAPLFPVGALIMSFFVPESPVYLIHRGKFDEAKKSYKKLFGEKYNADSEVEAIKSSMDKHRARKDDGLSRSIYETFLEKLSLLKLPEVYKPLLIILFLNIGQQLNGLSVLRVYIVQIFNYIFTEEGKDADHYGKIFKAQNASDPNDKCIETSDEGYYSAIMVGFFRLLASVLLSKLLLKYRRRSMYFVSSGLAILSLVSFSTFNFFVATRNLKESATVGLKWASLACACSLVFAVQLGVQTLPMLLSSELFPSEIRAFCKGLTRSFASILLIITLKFFPLMEESLTFYGTFYLFAAILILSLPVVYYTLPETKGISLELIRYYFTPHQGIIVKNEPQTL